MQVNKSIAILRLLFIQYDLQKKKGNVNKRLG